MKRDIKKENIRHLMSIIDSLTFYLVDNTDEVFEEIAEVDEARAMLQDYLQEEYNITY
jgi:hypothetical protein